MHVSHVVAKAADVYPQRWQTGYHAGALRVLVPEGAAGAPAQLLPERTPCGYPQEGPPGEPGMPALVWNDDSAQPYRVVVATGQPWAIVARTS